MSTGGIAAPLPPTGLEGSPVRPVNPLREWARRLTPSQGWTTLALLTATLLVVGESINAATWVATPGLNSILVWSAITALLLSKVRGPAVFLHPLGLAVGFVVVVWQTASLVEGEPLVQQVQEIWSRLELWWDAASSGGISRDLMPFSMAILFLSWMLGYLSSWFIFRSNNVWVAVVLGGISILTNLSFLPDNYAFRFFIFTFFAMLLVVRMSVVHREEELRKSSIESSPSSGWLTLHGAAWFSVVVVLVAALLPIRVVVSRPMAKTWNWGRSPVERLENEFGRLFSSIPSRKNLSGRFFGDALPFMGKISFGGEVVAWVNSEYPSYWLSRTYSEYTSQGWKAGETSSVAVGPDTVTPQRSDELKRTPVNQTLQLTFNTSDFLAGGNLEWISRDVVLETLEPKQFEIDLLDPSRDVLLPEEIQELAEDLREGLSLPQEGFVQSQISRILPSDMVLIDVEEDKPAIITVARKDPITPHVVSWKLSDRLYADEAYSMVSVVSVASNEDLRKAGTEYSGFIRDHYLQIPPTLPQRVRDLAERLIQGAETPLDKAKAIEAYLRGPDFEYSQDIDEPPRAADGVDHFLFTTGEGYSDYFASSMAVMLRAVGVPARLAAGYAPGEFEPDVGLRAIRDTDSHGWVQVYFPGYGWIDFEPTTRWPGHDREIKSGADPDDITGDLGDFLPREG